MHIGLTYDLRSAYLAAGYSEEETAEFDREETIDSLASALARLGHKVDRIGHAKQLTQRLVAGDRWDLVFNICEGLRGLGREAQVPAILDLYEIPYTFSDALVMAVSLHKGMTKAVLRDAGIPTPRYRVISSRDEADGCATDGRPLAFPAFAKPVAEGTGKGVTPASKLRSLTDLWPTCERLLTQFQQPVLVEEFLPGREFTVGLVGTGANAKVIGTLEIVLKSEAEPEVYSYVNKEQCEDLVEYRLTDAKRDSEVAEAERIALDAWRALGGRDAGRADLRSDAQGRPQFLEVNPLAGLHPQHSDLPMICTAVGMSYDELIRHIVESAAARAVAPRDLSARRA
jgi:D-alanine-D-alanine ligase